MGDTLPQRDGLILAPTFHAPNPKSIRDSLSTPFDTIRQYLTVLPPANRLNDTMYASPATSGNKNTLASRFLKQSGKNVTIKPSSVTKDNSGKGNILKLFDGSISASIKPSAAYASSITDREPDKSYHSVASTSIMPGNNSFKGHQIVSIDNVRTDKAAFPRPLDRSIPRPSALELAPIISSNVTDEKLQSDDNRYVIQGKLTDYYDPISDRAIVPIQEHNQPAKSSDDINKPTTSDPSDAKGYETLILQEKDQDYTASTSAKSSERTINSVLLRSRQSLVNREVPGISRVNFDSDTMTYFDEAKYMDEERPKKPSLSLTGMLENTAKQSKSSKAAAKEKPASTKRSKTKVPDNDIIEEIESAPASKRSKPNEKASKAVDRPASSTLASTSLTLAPSLTLDDFDGISKFCRNIGNTRRGFERFREDFKKSSSVVLSIMWNDLTTNHVTSTAKYCTPSVHCQVWHCTCDRHVRVRQATKPLIGAVIMFPSEPSIVYFLPLSSCTGDGDAGRSNLIILPLKCEISLHERWNLMAHILSYESCAKIVYNSPLLMLPMIHHISTMVSSIDNFHIKSIYDIKIAQYVIDSTSSEASLELKMICEKYDTHIHRAPNYHMGIVAQKVNRLMIDMANIFEIYQATKNELIMTNTIDVFFNIEMPISLLLSRMELRGIRVSQQNMNHLRDVVIQTKDKAISTAHREAKSTFNLGSPDQVAELLYDKLKLPPPHQTTTKRHHSTSEEDLIRIRDRQPVIIDAILAFRTLSKVVSNNIEGLECFFVKESELCPSDSSRISREDDVMHNPAHVTTYGYRVHAIWNQTIARTGRLSCCKPNLQNIPNNMNDMYGVQLNVRSLFTASEGHALISTDYSQMEVRVMAHISGDRELQRLLLQENDVYKQLAAAIFNKASESISDVERGRAKTICLGKRNRV